MDYSRVLHPDDYKKFTAHLAVDDLIPRLGGVGRYEHEHRKWEYGLALQFLLENEVNTVLDVGGAGSIFSPLLAYYGMDVTQTDLISGDGEVEKQNKILNTDIKFFYADFSEEDLDFGMYDAVVSISTIEHVPNDKQFFKNLLSHSKGLVFLTTDFSMLGNTFSKYHLRTYSKDTMDELAAIGANGGFYWDFSNYFYRGNFVYDYTFASLALKRYK